MNALEQNLQDVGAKVMRMLSMVRESCDLAKQALIDADTNAAERCIDNDKAIDSLQAELDQSILTVIARRQPAARDLRFLGAMHLALNDIERAGDYAEHIARAGAELASTPPLKKYIDMERIFEVLSVMLQRTIKAVAESSIEEAQLVLQMDDEIDDLYEQIQRELLTYMMENPKLIGQATQLLSVGRYLERLGDHIENVNEHIIFWVSGKRVGEHGSSNLN